MKRFSLGLITGLIAGLILATTTFAFAGDSIKLLVNGRQIYSDVPPQIISGRTMIPARALAESLGAQVDWDADTSTVVVTKPEKTVIIEPKPLNTTGRIEVTGSQEFKNSIEQALSLLQEKAPEDFTLVSGFITRIEMVNSGPVANLNTQLPGGINFNYSAFQTNSSKITDSTKTIYLAGILVHEAYHVYINKKGMIKALGPGGLSLMELEVLSFTRERQFYKKIGAPKALLDVTSLDYVVDTNYYSKKSTSLF